MYLVRCLPSLHLSEKTVSGDSQLQPPPWALAVAEAEAAEEETAEEVAEEVAEAENLEEVAEEAGPAAEVAGAEAGRRCSAGIPASLSARQYAVVCAWARDFERAGMKF